MYPPELIPNEDKLRDFTYCCDCRLARRSKFEQQDIFDEDGNLKAMAIPQNEASQFIDGSYNIILCDKHKFSSDCDISHLFIVVKGELNLRWDGNNESLVKKISEDDYRVSPSGAYTVSLRALVSKEKSILVYDENASAKECPIRVFADHDPFICNFFHFKSRAFILKNEFWESVELPNNKPKKYKSRVYHAVRELLIDVAVQP